ncbi:MAG: ATP-binding protein [Pseudomonadota bacterium]
MTLDELKKLLQSSENEHIEYKEAKTQYDVKKLMKYCVAFANEGGGQLVLGVNDQRKIIGSQAFKDIGEIKSKILEKLHIRVDIDELHDGEKRVLVLNIPARPRGTALHFDGAYFMRSGEDLVPMSPDQLQRIFAEGKPVFEHQLAIENLSGDDVVSLLDVQSYFDLINIPLPKTQQAILDRFSREKIVIKENELYSITNLGAILFAKNLNHFETLARKAVRLIVYDGNSKIYTKLDITGVKGYAVAFKFLIQYIIGQIKTHEVIEKALRKQVYQYPELAIRELVANALIHQDFESRGNNVMIEIYDNRIEISNPGKPIITVDRFIDEYQSRNEKLADLMRRLHICEEKGSGIDKALIQIEADKLPALDIREGETRTTVSMQARKAFSDMNKSERIQACYQHCCLKYVMSEMMTNQSFRERLGISDAKTDREAVSRTIAATLEKNMIRLNDPENSSKRYAKYVPYWS